MFVQKISSKPPNILLPNLVLWCSILSWSVMQKDWFAIFKVKVTARAYMIIIWQFLLYLLNCWFFGNQTCLLDTASRAKVSSEENWITGFKVKVTAKGHNISLARWYLLNRKTFCYQTWYCDTSSWAGVSCKMIGLLFLRSRAHMIKLWQFQLLSSELLNCGPFDIKLVLKVHYHKPEYLMKKLDYCVQGQGHSKILNFECLSRYYLLIRQTFTTKPGVVMQHHEWDCLPKWLVFCLQGKGHSEGLYIPNMTF